MIGCETLCFSFLATDYELENGHFREPRGPQMVRRAPFGNLCFIALDLSSGTLKSRGHPFIIKYYAFIYFSRLYL